MKLNGPTPPHGTNLVIIKAMRCEKKVAARPYGNQTQPCVERSLLWCGATRRRQADNTTLTLYTYTLGFQCG